MDVEQLANAMPAAKKRQQSLEEKVRVKTENNRVFVSWASFTIIGLWILLLQAAGVAFFTRGFLLSRPVFEDHSSCDKPPLNSSQLQRPQGSQGCWMEQQFDRAVVVIIDALRFDFSVPCEDDLYYHNGLPILYDYSVKYPEHAFLTKFIADPPTTTLQRLKGLTTGSLPTFIDAGSNFAGTQIEEDNWVSQAYSANKSIAFMGDDTWTALFGKQFETSYPYESLNVEDLHTVDNGVISHLLPTLNEKPDIAIGHLLGVDHVGHRYGPNHPTMRTKLNQMNDFLKDVIEKIDDKTLLVVMGDHGMDSKGDHGGDSQLELESTLWLYSKKKAFGRLEGDRYNPVDQGRYFRQVEQIDLVPTLSLLLGLPIPYNNLGFPIAEAFLAPIKKNKNEKERLGVANYLTAAQIHRYRSKFDYDDDEYLWHDVKQSFIDGVDELVKTTENYQKQTLDQFRAQWVEFDMWSMYLGIGILMASLLVIFAHYRHGGDFQSYTTMKSISSVSAGAVVVGYGLTFVVTSLEPIYGVALGISCGVVIGSLQMVIRLFKNLPLRVPNLWTGLAVLFSIINCLSLSSNSFTIWEDKIMQFLLCTFGAAAVAKSLALGNVQERALGVWHSAVFILLTKLSSLSVLCREEQGKACQSTFYQDLSSSVSHPYALIGLAFLTLALPLVIKSFYSTSASYQGSASAWIGIGLRAVMAFTTVYWVLDGIDVYHWNVDVNPEFVKTTKLVLARTALGASLLAGNFAWWKGALCINVDIQPDQNAVSKVKASILGYSNSYGASYFLLIVNVFAASLVVNKPLGGIVLCGLLYQVLTLFEIVNLLHLRNEPLLISVVLGLLGNSYFFSTGHHATLPAVQWEMGFVPTTSITFPFTHLAIVLNTFAPVIITTLASPLTVLWKTPPSKNPTNLHSKVIEVVLLGMLYQGVVTTFSTIFTMQLRRHLMLWKIFAPRFMLAGIQLVVADLVAVIAMALSGKCIAYIYSVFG